MNKNTKPDADAHDRMQLICRKTNYCLEFYVFLRSVSILMYIIPKKTENLPLKNQLLNYAQQPQLQET